MRESKIPMIKHLDGICHIYIDDCADLEKATEIAFNAKCQRYGTCNTMETLLVSKNVALEALSMLAQRYHDEEVELRCDEKAHDILYEYPYLVRATETDWETEYLAPILSIRIVNNLDEAIDHINRYSSKHTDAIVTENYSHALRFLREVDSSSSWSTHRPVSLTVSNTVWVRKSASRTTNCMPVSRRSGRPDFHEICRSGTWRNPEITHPSRSTGNRYAVHPLLLLPLSART